MDRQKETYRVTIAGSIINILLLAFKFAAGILGHSAAMIADAIHSLTDFVTDAIVLVFVRLGSKPTDHDHDYGHGKYETLASAIIGVSLLVVGMMICYSGVTKTYHAMCGEPLQQPGFIALAAAVASVVLKEWAYRFTGIGGAIILGEKWAVLDPLTAIVVSFFIMKAAWSVLSKAVGELTDGSLPKETEDEIEKIVSEDKDVSVVHNLCTRRIGNRIAIEMHVRMPGETSLYVAHHHATEIEKRLKQRFGADTHISIHLEPVKVNGHYEDPAVRQEQPQP